CHKRHAAESLRTGIIVQLANCFNSLGLVGVYDPVSGTGNLAISNPVRSYLEYSAKEQKTAGIGQKQAAPLLRHVVESLLTRMGTNIRNLGTSAPARQEALELKMYRAVFATTFNSSRRGHCISHMHIARIFSLPNRAGFLCELLLGKTLRQQNTSCFGLQRKPEPQKGTCPVNLIEEWVAAASEAGFDMTRGHLFFRFELPARSKSYLDPRVMTKKLQRYLADLKVGNEKLTMHSFRVGSVICKLLEGLSLERVMHDAFWKKRKTLQHYARHRCPQPPRP
ncbi:unnamed protein product, partial [Heterosigma akashiwo]